MNHDPNDRDRELAFECEEELQQRQDLAPHVVIQKFLKCYRIEVESTLRTRDRAEAQKRGGGA